MRRFFQGFTVSIRCVIGVVTGRSIVPLYLQSSAAFHGSPGVGGYYCNTPERIKCRRLARAINAYSFLNTSDLQGLTVIDALHRRTIDRWSGHHCIEGVFQIHIGAKNRLAGDNVFTIDCFGVRGLQLAIDQAGFLANETQLTIRFQNQPVPARNVQLPCGFCKLAKAEFTSSGRMNNLMNIRPYLVDRYTPLIGRGLLKHQPGSSGRTAHGVVPVTHAAGTIGILVAKLILIAVCLFRANPVPVCAQFIRGHHNQAGANTLSHFGTVVDDGDKAVGVDMDKHIRVVYPAPRHGPGPELSLFIGQPNIPSGCEQERRGSGQPFEKTAAADIRKQQCVVGLAHELTSLSAARSMAARMRL